MFATVYMTGTATVQTNCAEILCQYLKAVDSAHHNIMSPRNILQINTRLL